MDTPILVAPSPPDLNKIAKGQEIQVCLKSMKINYFKKINIPKNKHNTFMCPFKPPYIHIKSCICLLMYDNFWTKFCTSDHSELLHKIFIEKRGF